VAAPSLARASASAIAVEYSRRFVGAAASAWSTWAATAAYWALGAALRAAFKAESRVPTCFWAASILASAVRAFAVPASTEERAAPARPAAARAAAELDKTRPQFLGVPQAACRVAPRATRPSPTASASA
jgi:hypothetical protein